MMQPRFDKRTGNTPFSLVEQPRFRAAFDFMRLRADVGEVDVVLADWWQEFSQASDAVREDLVAQLREEQHKGQRRVRAARRGRRTSRARPALRRAAAEIAGATRDDRPPKAATARRRRRCAAQAPPAPPQAREGGGDGGGLARLPATAGVAMRERSVAYVALGANLGDAAQALREALAHLGAVAGHARGAPFIAVPQRAGRCQWARLHQCRRRAATRLTAPGCWRSCRRWNRRRAASAPIAMRRARWTSTCCCMATRASTARAECRIRA